MVTEAARDRLTVTHEDVVTGMTIDHDRTLGFAANPGTKDPLEEDKDDLIKARMYLTPELLEGPPTKTINGVSIAKRLDTLWTDVTRKRDRQAAAEKAKLRILSDPNNGQDALPIPDTETDPVYDDSDNEYTDQLNL